MYNNKLATMISEGRLMKDNNRIFETELEIVNGVINLKTGSNLFTAISEFNPSLLPADKDGNVDIAQIKNIAYSGSNNENFVITLQNENEIKGKIIGKSIEIETSTIYRLELQDNQKNATLVPALEVIEANNLPLPEVVTLIKHLLGQAPDADWTSIKNIREKLRDVAKMIDDDSTMDYLDFPELVDLQKLVYDMDTMLSTQQNLDCKY